jgi:hypothetical protein
MEDFAGRLLCEACWNGAHWRHDPVTKVLINNCLLWANKRGDHCQCECKNIDFYKRQDRTQRAEAKARDRRAQQSLFGGDKHGKA